MNSHLLKALKIEYRHADFLRANPRRKSTWQEKQITVTHRSTAIAVRLTAPLLNQVIKLVPHLNRKERIPVVEEFRKTIRNQTKNDFRELVEKQKKGMPKWRKRAKVEEAASYILSNWTAAKLRLKHKNGVLGSSTESHISHILSARMSSRPMGWSRQGASNMSELRAYYYNGGDMLDLVRYQKKACPEEKKEEEKILSSTQILR